MQEGTWTEYAAPGTPTLNADDVEDAVARSVALVYTTPLTGARTFGFGSLGIVLAEAATITRL